MAGLPSQAEKYEVHPHKLRALLFRIAGIGMMILGPAAGLLLAWGVNPVLGLIVWVGISALATKLLKQAKRLRAVGAEEKLEEDTRQPVLYLRSFSADERAAEDVGQVLAIRGVELTTPKTEEEQIEIVTRSLGPMIAIGRPGETLPTIGASRMYVTEWQNEVINLMQKAQLVVMRAGKTEGFWWEMQQAVSLVAPDRLIWLIPFSKDNYTHFAERANLWLPKPIPTDVGQLNGGVGSLKAWIWFERDWTPHVEKPGRYDDGSLGLPVAALLQQVLAPTFRRLGRPDLSIRCAGWSRVMAFGVDLLIVWAFAGLAAVVKSDWVAAVSFVGTAAYLMLMDLPQIGRSIGKRVMKLRTLASDGRQPSTIQVIARNLLNILLLPVNVIYAPVSIGWSLQRKLPQDWITRTYVVARNHS